MKFPELLQSIDREGAGVPGVVVFTTGGSEVTLATDANGRVNVPAGCDRNTYAVIKPRGPHWSAFLDFASLPECEGISVTMVPLDIQRQAHWWRRLFDRCDHPCEDLRIGIIDLASCDTADLTGLETIDADGMPLDTSSHPSETHGYFVAQVFAGWQETGALGKARFLFADVSEPGREGRKIDALAVLSALASLREDFGVDLINMSLGFDMSEFVGTPYEADVQDFCENLRAEIAACPGLVVAAAGNSDAADVKVPARFDEVVAVTGVAPSSAAFEGTRMALWRLRAAYEGGLGKCGNGEEYFHLKGLTFGEEIDAVAPGAGIWLRGADGRPVENEGSSFAAPIVTAALACAIARRKENDSNFAVSKEILSEICVDVGLDRQKQGYGIPLNP